MENTRELFEHFYSQRGGRFLHDQNKLYEMLTLTNSTNRFLNFFDSVYFLDKTLLLKEILLDEKFLLIIGTNVNLTSVNLSMMKRFLEITVIEQDGRLLSDVTHTKQFQSFRQTDIYQNQIVWKRYFNQFPVVYSCMDVVCTENVLQSFKIIISSTFYYHTYLLGSQQLDDFEKSKFIQCYTGVDLTEEDMETSLKFLCEILYKHFKKKVIVLVENYDSQILQAICNGRNTAEKMVKITKNLLSNTFKWNEYLDRAIVTGVCYLSDVGVDVFNTMELYKYLEARSLQIDCLSEYGLGCFKVCKISQSEKLKNYFTFTQEDLMKWSQLPDLDSSMDYFTSIERRKQANVYPVKCMNIPRINEAVHKIMLGEAVEVPFVDKICVTNLIGFETLLLQPDAVTDDQVNLFLQLLCEMGGFDYVKKQDLGENIYEVRLPVEKHWDALCEPFKRILMYRDSCNCIRAIF